MNCETVKNSYYENGALLRREFYKDDVLVAEETYDEDGYLIMYQTFGELTGRTYSYRYDSVYIENSAEAPSWTCADCLISSHENYR